MPRVTERTEVGRVLKTLMGNEWVVGSKPCLARTETVVDYLGRYSHRIALTDRPLLNFDGDPVDLAYKDYRDGDRRKVMHLRGEGLIRRFLLHVLRLGFMRVRHFGSLATVADGDAWRRSAWRWLPRRPPPRTTRRRRSRSMAIRAPS